MATLSHQALAIVAQNRVHHDLVLSILLVITCDTA